MNTYDRLDGKNENIYLILNDKGQILYCKVDPNGKVSRNTLKIYTENHD